VVTTAERVPAAAAFSGNPENGNPVIPESRDVRGTGAR